MFSGPSASRGKQRKGKDEEKADKKQLQKATKAQRKAGGLRRGGDYEVEAVGEIFGADGVAGRSDDERKPSAEEEDEEEDEDAEEASPSKFRPPTRAATGNAGISEDDDEEMIDIKQGIKAQLLGWANDPGMPMDEQKRCVRQLLAQWHPDKNRHIGSVATEVFQFIQEEVNRIVEQYSDKADTTARKAHEARERKAQRSAEKSAKTAALEAARQEKQQKKGKEVEEPAVADVQDEDRGENEWSLVVGHGPATAAFLRPWPRSHFSLTLSPLPARADEILLFGGEAYDGRELTFYSDLYRLDMGQIQEDTPLPWEKLYSAVPMIPGPDARSAHQSITWEKYVYVFGGEWSSRDQKRYRQFNDLWRFDCTGKPGSRWERVDAQGAIPSARSGHRMASAPGGHAVLFGGFSEDKKRRATYLDDLYTLHLPSQTWRLMPSASDRRSARPVARAGSMLFVAGGNAFVYGGSRPVRKGADALQIMDDLWRSSLSTDGSTVWEQVAVDGQGPGRRSGLCQCALSRDDPHRRLVFGGVADHKVASSAVGSKSRVSEVSVFHQDVFLLDCSTAAGTSPLAHWTRLWPPPSGSPLDSKPLEPKAEDLTEEFLAKGGGTDAQSLSLVRFTGKPSKISDVESTRDVPRGRMAASCVVSQGSLWIFGGSCESGPKQEVTLDDFWRLDLKLEHQEGSVRVSCADRWKCVLPLSDRATVWFDDSSSDSEEEEESTAGLGSDALVAVNNTGGGVLSKKAQKAEAKQQRMEIKRERQAEKCEEKTSKRELKKEKQRQQAKDR